MNFTPDIKDTEYFSVPDEYANTDFVVDGQGSVFDGQVVRVLEAVTPSGTAFGTTGASANRTMFGTAGAPPPRPNGAGE